MKKIKMWAKRVLAAGAPVAITATSAMAEGFGTGFTVDTAPLYLIGGVLLTAGGVIYLIRKGKAIVGG